MGTIAACINCGEYYDIGTEDFCPSCGLRYGAKRMAVMKLSDTRIPLGGIYRCCLADVATEYDGKEIELGMKSTCHHCKTEFTLVAGNKYPEWKPDWQLKV